MNPYRLFLDDERKPKDVTWVELPPGPWTIARDYNMFVDIIQRLGVPDFVTFDHDLGDEAYRIAIKRELEIDYSSMREKTGFHCVRWLIEYCLEHNIKIPPYQVHSMNPIGVENIRAIMENGIRYQNSLDKSSPSE